MDKLNELIDVKVVRSKLVELLDSYVHEQEERPRRESVPLKLPKSSIS